MNKITIKKQEEWNRLDKDFKEPTTVIFQDAVIDELKENYNNCSIELRGSSMVQYMTDSSVIQYMYDSSVVKHMFGSSMVQNMRDSSVVQCMFGSSMVQNMRDSSVVQRMTSFSVVQRMTDSSVVQYMFGSSVVQCMYDSSVVQNMRGSSVVQKAFDSAVVFTGRDSVEFFDSGVTVKRRDIQSSFETLLDHNILRADGITKGIKSVRDVDESTKIYLLDNDTYCAQRGSTFAHAKTLKMSLIDLNFKLSDRDKSQYENLKPNDELSFDESVTCYRTITGACSGGVEDFLERHETRDKYTIAEIIELTKEAYGGSMFKEFFSEKEKGNE